MEGSRPRAHALTVSVVTRLGLLVLSILLIDAALERRVRHRSRG